MGAIDQDAARRYWNGWNARAREHGQDRVALEQARVVEGWLQGRRELSILEAGCGAGWMSERLAAFGSVVAMDQADEVVRRAQQRVPTVRFEVGDLLTDDLGSGYDVVVSLEVLAHVADQARYLSRLREALVPGGQLLLATQNKPVLTRLNRIPPPGPGQLRRWVDRAELRELVEAASFTVQEMFVITPQSNRGLTRVLAKAGRVTRTDRALARLGFGWTIMLSARAV
jgi:2-polyprenyl-3-methyl-5-hydroxy-6-metoxy-1,4-benzoquinol methylase